MSPIVASLASSSAQGYGGLRTFAPGTAFESIATVNGNGSANSVTFSNIPQTYSHLQIRYVARAGATGFQTGEMTVTINGQTTTAWGRHNIQGNGASNSVGGGGISGANGRFASGTADIPGQTISTNALGMGIIDIIDYSLTNKTKIFRVFSGYDVNSTSGVALINIGSTAPNSNAAITSITIGIATGSDFFTTTSSFALYGIKG